MNPLLSLLFRGISIGRVAGIPITVNWTWIPVAILLATGLFAHIGGGGFGFMLALAATGIFFASIVAHELGHALTARTVGIRTSDITLHLLGGVAKIQSEPKRPWDEFAIAAAGPLVSFALGGVFAGIAAVVRYLPVPGSVVDIFGWLAFTNLVLALVNLLPGLPLDGGRIMRAWMWQKSGNYLESTIRAAKSGETIGTILIVLSLISIVMDGPLGFVSVIAGWFMVSAARQEMRRLLPAMSPVEYILRRFLGARWQKPYGAWRTVSDAFARSRPQKPPPRRDPEVIDVDFVVTKKK